MSNPDVARAVALGEAGGDRVARPAAGSAYGASVGRDGGELPSRLGRHRRVAGRPAFPCPARRSRHRSTADVAGLGGQDGNRQLMVRGGGRCDDHAGTTPHRNRGLPSRRLADDGCDASGWIGARREPVGVLHRDGQA